MQRHVVGSWLCWLLASAAVTSGPGTAAAVELQAPAEERIDTILYCNYTTPCKPCLPKHLNTQACKPTAHAQHLACALDMTYSMDAQLLLHRRVLPEQLPLHVSRTCSPNQQSGAEEEEPRADHGVTEHADAAEDSSAVATSGGGGAGDEQQQQQQQRPVQLHYRFGGGVNLLYFEVFMVLVLAGSVPLVCYRKRRYVRL